MSNASSKSSSHSVHTKPAPTPATPSRAAKRKRVSSSAATPAVGVLLTGPVDPAATEAPKVLPPTTSKPLAVTSTATLPGAVPATTSLTTSGVAATLAASSSRVDDPPTVDAPTPPDGFVLTPGGRGIRGFLPTVLELAALGGVIKDLASFADYVDVLGNKAPPAATLQSKIGTSLRWRASRTLAETWAAYVKTEDALSWKETAVLLEELKVLFRIAMAKDAILAGTYPSLAAYCDATNDAVAKGQATRKKNASTLAATATANAIAAAKAEATAAATAATPGKVTVNA